MIQLLAALMAAAASGEPAPAQTDTQVSGVEVTGTRPTPAERRKRRLDPNVVLCKVEARSNGMAERICLTRGAWNEKARDAQAVHRDFLARASQMAPR